MIFTSDNGLLWGEHRWVKKEVPYEEAIRVPLIRADRMGAAPIGTDPPSSRTSISRRRSRRRQGCPFPERMEPSFPLLEGRPDGRHAL